MCNTGMALGRAAFRCHTTFIMIFHRSSVLGSVSIQTYPIIFLFSRLWFTFTSLFRERRPQTRPVMKFSEMGYLQLRVKLQQCSAITNTKKTIVRRGRDTNFLNDRVSAETEREMGQIFTG